MKTFYIIGSGFDLFHGLDTRYCSFGLFLKNNYVDIYDKLMEYIGIPDVGNERQGLADHVLWRDFEQTLSLLDSEIVYEAFSGSLANPGSSDFSDRDWNTFAIDMKLVVETLTSKLLKAFNEFILNLNYPCLKEDDLIRIDKSALYLSFNYTNTLEHYYNIPKDNILYIHGKAAPNNNDLILGHGIVLKNFPEEDPMPPKNSTPEELEMWWEQMADQHDYSFELGKQELMDYFIKSLKPTNKVISANSNFFTRAKDIENIFILGHSLSETDMPYFEEIVSSLKGEPIFTVSFYNDGEKSSHQSTLVSLGIKEEKINLVKIDELK